MNKQTEDGSQTGWKSRAVDLARWALDRLVNRTDAWGAYRDGGPYTAKETDDGDPLDAFRLERHFEGRTIIGIHLVSLDNTCCSVAVDIDAHGDDATAENWEIASVLYGRAVELGLAPLLTDSNGRGGFHLEILFAVPIPSELAYRFVMWLCRDYTPNREGCIEAFPKRADRHSTSGYGGGWLRLPGKHHTRDHWSRVWDGEQWLEGNAAIDAILSHQGDDAATILAVTPDKLEPEAKETPTEPAGALKQEAFMPILSDRVALAHERLAKIEPPDPSPLHPMDASQRLLDGAAICVGYGLSDDEAVATLRLWSPIYPEGEYRRKVKEALKVSERGGLIDDDDFSWWKTEKLRVSERSWIDELKPDGEPAEPDDPAPDIYPFISTSELLSARYERTFYIDDCLVAGMPCIVGRKKDLQDVRGRR